MSAVAVITWNLFLHPTFLILICTIIELEQDMHVGWRRTDLRESFFNPQLI